MLHAYGNVGDGIRPVEGTDVNEGNSGTKYISDADYLTGIEAIDTQMAQVDDMITEREDFIAGLIPVTSYTPEDYNQAITEKEELEAQRETLKEQRELSIEVDNYSTRAYISEEEAAVAFAQTANTATQSDGNERVAMMMNYEVPVINSSGDIVYEKRTLLTDTMEGQPNNVIPQLFALYAAKGVMYPDTTVSFIHTHPGTSDEFSGEEGETIFHIVNQVVKYYYGLDNTHFSNFLGDAQVPWLPKVDKMYLVSPTENEIYACDNNGPIEDATSKSGYYVITNY